MAVEYVYGVAADSADDSFDSSRYAYLHSVVPG